MTRLLPYPLLALSLLAVWLLLNRPSLGHLLLGSIVAIAACLAMSRLQPSKPRIRRWRVMPKLALIVLGDVMRSNITVATLILHPPQRRRVSGFITIPLDLRDRTALTVLACIVTSTPGTAWVEYDSMRGTLLLHVFDLVDETEWISLIKDRYEHLLMEIFA